MNLEYKIATEGAIAFTKYNSLHRTVVSCERVGQNAGVNYCTSAESKAVYKCQYKRKGCPLAVAFHPNQ